MSSESKTSPLSVKQNLVWNTVGSLIYQGCIWATTVLVVLLSHDYANSGYLAYAMALGNMLYTLATYNMRSVQVSDSENRFSAQEYIGFRLATIVVGVVVMLIYAIATTSSYPLLMTTCCFFLFKIDESFCCVYYAIEQKAGRMDYIGVSQAVRGILIIVLFSLGLTVFNSIYSAIIFMSLGCIAITFIFDAKKANMFGSVSPVFSINVFSVMAKRYSPSFISLLCYSSVVSLARQIFGNMYGEEALGVYAAIATPTVIVQLAATFLMSPFLVTLSKTAAEGNRRAFLRSFLTIIAGLLLVFILLIVLAFFFGERALTLLYGDSMIGSRNLFVMVIIATSLVAFASVFLDTLIAVGEIKLLMPAYLLAVILCLVLANPLMTAFQAQGVNLTIITSFGATLVVDIALLVRHLAKMRPANEE